MTPLAAYLLLFAAVGVAFILVHLVAGALIRPKKPDAEKDTIYECGEPTIGSAWVQFDLRYYVVALLFVVFDVEVAFFFPWAELFGKANAVANAKKPTTPAEHHEYAERMLELAVPERGANAQAAATQERFKRMREVTQADLEATEKRRAEAIAKPEDERTAAERRAARSDGEFDANEFDANREQARSLAQLALVEVLVFFGVLLVGFAYLWRRGDLQWVRATTPAQPAYVESAEEAKAGEELVGTK